MYMHTTFTPLYEVFGIQKAGLLTPRMYPPHHLYIPLEVAVGEFGKIGSQAVLYEKAPTLSWNI